MPGILLQLMDNAVVVAVHRIAEFLLAFQDDRDRTVGIEFLEVMA